MTAPADVSTQAREVLTRYGMPGAELVAITTGHINRTYRVEAGADRRILQRLNPIFAPEVHEDIEAITAHLEQKGLHTPRLVRTSSGELWTRDSHGGIWRMLTFIDGAIHARATTPELCRAAGELVARFHLAVRDLHHTFKHRRPGLHDTARHLQHLREVLKTHRHHPSHGIIEAMAREILDLASGLPSLNNAEKRITHNDLKITNVVFADEQAVALIDLDTLAEMSIPIELGDAFRSWCNPESEDHGEVTFSLAYFDAGLAGYGAYGKELVSRADKELIPPAVATISLELAARFAADALEESYFGWDKTRFPSSSAHNLMRARTQLSLGKSVIAQLPELTRVVTRQLG